LKAAAYIKDAERGRLTLIQVLQSLVTLYPAHIWKEDYLLFPMADKILAESDQELLLRQFAKAEEVLGTNAHERFEKLAVELSERIDHCPQCDQEVRRA
jgi:hemerythrin-like domain-containing protein